MPITKLSISDMIEMAITKGINEIGIIMKIRTKPILMNSSMLCFVTLKHRFFAVA